MKLFFACKSYKFIPLILLGMAKPAQITQNNKFSKSLQYLEKEVENEVNFLCNKQHGFL